MSDAHAKAIRDVAASVSTIRTGTVSTDYAAVGATYVTLDNDPSSTPVRAVSMAGVFPVGTRVGLISYPPRGLAILGRLDGNGSFTNVQAVIQLVVGLATGPHVNVNSNQIWAMSGAASSPLFLNFSSSGTVNIGDGTTAGAGLVAVRMRPIAAEGGNISPTTGSTTFVNLGTTATDVTIPYSPSGILEVTIGGGMQYNITTVGQFAIVSFEIRDTNAAGTVRWAASDNFSMFLSAPGLVGQQLSSQRIVLATGLPTSGTAFVRPMFRVTSSNMTLSRPYTIVRPIV